MKFESAVGCGAIDYKVYEEIEEAYEYLTKARSWLKGELQEHHFRAFVDSMNTKGRAFNRCFANLELELQKEEVQKLEDAGLWPRRNVES